MKTKSSVTKTIGPVAAKLINEILQSGKTIFSLEEASLIYGKNRTATSIFIKDLIKRDILARIKSGVYLILQTGQENIQLSNWPVIARELAMPNEYFISHYSAMRIHGMTTHPLLDIFITLSKRQRSKKINNIIYHFVYSKPNYFWGGSHHWVGKQDKVMVSDLERTILDGLDRPDLCGGIKEITRGILAKKNEINWEKLKQYIKKYPRKAAVKRLGFILEMLNIGMGHIAFIHKIIAPGKDYIFLDPSESKIGKRVSRWRIRLNINIMVC